MPPPPCTVEHWSSSELEPAARLAYWHDVAHNWVDAQPLAPGDELDASWSLLRSEVCLFGTKRSTAYEMRTGSQHVPPNEDMVILSLLEAGEMQLNGTAGEQHRAGAGMLGLYAPQRKAHYRWGAHARQTYVALPRREAWACLGRDAGNVLISPQQSPLAPLLSSQMAHLARLARLPGALDASEYATLLEATRALALLTLRNLGRQGQPDAEQDARDPLHAGRHAAALRFMQQNAHRHDLDAAAIAHGAHCSRTRLYEAFAARGETVMGALREARLQRARLLIEQSPRLNVGALAWRCGFADPSAFSKLFRARFGLSPTEWRLHARGSLAD
ncbi:AraC family transcriptional regulator [Ottowia sp.]|uniref:helix-turn-helix transcriptional regulator n=1 Tax=Ottowia sp. TaxID=1898956 RepID=UPI002D09BA46|nr:AraC family transcriptional regulator [Ottowia sp.]